MIEKHGILVTTRVDGLIRVVRSTKRRVVDVDGGKEG